MAMAMAMAFPLAPQNSDPHSTTLGAEVVRIDVVPMLSLLEVQTFQPLAEDLATKKMGGAMTSDIVTSMPRVV